MADVPRDPGTGSLQIAGGKFAQAFLGPGTGTGVFAGATPTLQVVSAGGSLREPASGTVQFVGSEQDVLIIVLPAVETLVFAGAEPTVATAGAGAVLRLPECGLVRVAGTTPVAAVPGPLVRQVPVGTVLVVGAQPTSTGGASEVGGNPLQARAAIARAGVTYAAWAPPVATFTIGGVDRSADIRKGDAFQIADQLEQASTLTFRVVDGAAPTVGQEVLITVCTPDEYLFAGHLLRVTVARISAAAQTVYDCEALDYTWLLDRYKRVWGHWAACGINTVVADILDRFTDGGFAIGSVPASLGDVDAFIARGETVSDTLGRLAKMAGGYWRINPRAKTIDVFTPGADNDGNAPTWGNSSDLVNLTVTTDASQLRTRTEVIGGGAATTAVTTGGSSVDVSCAVDEVGWYTVAGGRLRPDYQKYTPTGGDLAFANDKSVASGPGIIVIEPPADDIPSGTTVNVVGVQESSGSPSAAEIAWAATLGGGLSGFVQHLIQDGRLSAQEAQDRAEADVAMFEYPTQTVSYTTTDRWARLGQYIASSITTPVAVQGTFVCQHMTLTPRRVDGVNVEWHKRVTAGPYRRDLSDLLRVG